MSIPKLKMCMGDVKVAVNREFKKRFKEITFAGHTFKSIDHDSSVCFTLQSPFEGKGEYVVEGTAKLCDETSCQLYLISGTVTVREADDSPVISFPYPLSVRKK